MKKYAHLLEVDEEKKQISIYRVGVDGEKQFFTSVDLPSKTFSEDEDGFRRFAAYLGENLLVIIFIPPALPRPAPRRGDRARLQLLPRLRPEPGALCAERPDRTQRRGEYLPLC